VSEKPTLHEIAAMPFPASVDAMRRFYNKDWGKPVPDDGKLRAFKVRVDYSFSGSGSEALDIEAYTAEEAEEKALEELDGLVPDDADDWEADEVKVTETDPTPKGAMLS
jgi:hypothetical protein